MRLSKILSLALPAGLVIAALVAGGTASAAELCKVEEASCSATNLYGEGTAIVAKAAKAEIVTPSLTATCTSTMEGKNMVDASTPLPLYISSLTFAECKSGETKCSMKMLHLPYYGVLEYTSENVGTVTLSDWGEGRPSGTFECGSIKCTMGEKELKLSAKGGKPMTLKATKDSLTKESGASCPESASLTAEYSVTTPSQANIQQTVSRLCKNAPVANVCAMADRFTGDTTIKMISASAKLKTSAAEFLVTCEEAPMKGEGFTANGAGTLGTMEFNTGGLACSSNFLGSPGVKVTVAPMPSPVSVNLTRALNGFFTLAANAARQITLEILYLPTPIVCVYGVTRPLWKVVGTAPMKLKSLWLTTRIAANMNCPVGMEIEAELEVTRAADGGNLWVAW
jgi:hypothetical protein